MRRYWCRLNVHWLSITLSTYETQVGLTMVHALPGGSRQITSEVLLSRCCHLMPQIHGARRQEATKGIADDTGCGSLAAQSPSRCV
jgi:hypothetical protein